MKHLGLHATYETMMKLSNKMKAHPKRGTQRYDVQKQLDSKLAKFKIVRKYPTIKEVDKHLDKGGIVLLNYRWDRGKEHGYHYAVFFKRTKNFYSGYNEKRYETTSRRNKKKVKTYFKKHSKKNFEGRKLTYPFAWFISNE